MEYYYPGGGLLKLDRELTDDERMEYAHFLWEKGIYVRLQDIVVEDGRVVIKMET